MISTVYMIEEIYSSIWKQHDRKEEISVRAIEIENVENCTFLVNTKCGSENAQQCDIYRGKMHSCRLMNTVM